MKIKTEVKNGKVNEWRRFKKNVYAYFLDLDVLMERKKTEKYKIAHSTKLCRWFDRNTQKTILLMSLNWRLKIYGKSMINFRL